MYWSLGGSVTQDFTKDFFISYSNADRAWAEWIAWQLEASGFSTVLQAWDFRPGSNFALNMHTAIQATTRTIAVLSPDYLANAAYSASEWAATFVQDPGGKRGTLLPVRVRDCEPPGLLAAITYIDLVEHDEADATQTLLAGIGTQRAKPATAPDYPRDITTRTSPRPGYPAHWPEHNTVPYSRNPFFSGRDALLQQLHDRLTTTRATALIQSLAISGLGGIGKTQTADEYIYRYEHAYRYILWVTAATAETIQSDFTSIATRLKIPSYDPQDQRTVVPALQQWLTKERDWLLVLDNADDLPMVRSFLPPKPNPGGHMLLTTRARATGAIAQSIEIDKMDNHEGILLLLRRSGFIGPDEQAEQVAPEASSAAQAIVSTMDGLPLALDQAGGYIEEIGCTLSDYLQFYQQHRQELLSKRSSLSPDYPATVATTWSLAFQRIEQDNPAATALLQFCAFLAPDAIPEDLMQEIADASGTALEAIVNDRFKLNGTLEILRRYSLIRRNAETKTLSLHRLVQVVLQDSMSQEKQILWANCVIATLDSIFLMPVEQWFLLEQYIPHAYTCLNLIERYGLITWPAARVLMNAGNYLQAHAQYKIAEAFYQKAVNICEILYESEDAKIALPLYRIGQLYHFQDRFKEAEVFYTRALTIYMTLQGQENEIAEIFHVLAQLYHRQGLYQQAKEAYMKALDYYEKTLTESAKYDVVILLHQLATLYEEQGNYQQAEEIFRMSVLNMEVSPLLTADTTMSTVLNILTKHYQNKGGYEKMEAHYLFMLNSAKKLYGAEHPTTATILHELGWHRRGQGRYDEAEEFYQQALSIREKILGIEHADTATTIHYLAELKWEQGKAEEAKMLYYKELDIRKKVLGNEHMTTGVVFHELARIYEDQELNDKAEQYYLQALDVYEKVLGNEHLDIVRILSELARVYEAQNKYDAAIQVQLRTLSIYKNNPENEPQDIPSVLSYLAKLYQAQQDYVQAESYYQQALSMQEQELGIDHPDMGKTLRGYADLLRALNRVSEALAVEARIKSL